MKAPEIDGKRASDLRKAREPCELILLDSDPGTMRVGEFARRLGIRVRNEVFSSDKENEQRPSMILLASGIGCDQSAHREELRGRGLHVESIEDLGDPAGSYDAPYLRSLSPSEQLFTQCRCPAERIEACAATPDHYLKLTHDRLFRKRLQYTLSGGRGEVSEERLLVRWQESIKTLAQLGRVRDLVDMNLILAPQSIRPLALEAYLCVRRCTHDWVRDGVRLPHVPLLFLFHEGDQLPQIDATSGGDPVTALTGFDFYTDDAGPLPLKADFARSGFHWWLDAAEPHFKHRLRIEFPDLRHRKAGHGDWVDKLLDRLIGAHLVYGRPLRHYACTFLLPFDPCGGDWDHKHKDGRWVFEPDEELRWKYPTYTRAELKTGVLPNSPRSTAAADAQAYWYFIPAIRDLLYEFQRRSCEDTRKPVEEWRVPEEELQNWRIELGAESEAAAAQHFQKARATGLHLFRYFNGLYLFALTVEPEAVVGLKQKGAPALLFSEEASWWQAIAFSSNDDWKHVQELQLNAWSHFTRLARVLYPEYVEQTEEKKIARLCLKRTAQAAVEGDAQSHAVPAHIPKHAGQALSDVVRALFKRFFGERVTLPTRHIQSLDECLDDYRELHDSHMFVNVSYGLAGRQIEKTRLHKLFAVLLFLDRKEDTYDSFNGYSYDPAYLRPSLEQASFPMWEGIGTFYGYTEFSNVSLGFGDFYCEIIAPRHVHIIYERMLIQALLYQASLRYYSRKISDATRQLVQGAGQTDFHTVRMLREEFIQFTNEYWFHDLTAQLQGREIFRRQQEALGLKREYEFIKDEMERTDEFIEARDNRRMQKNATGITYLGMILGLFALWVTFFSYLTDVSELCKSSDKVSLVCDVVWLDWIMGLVGAYPVAAPVVVTIIVFALVVFTWRHLLGWWDKGHY